MKVFLKYWLGVCSSILIGVFVFVLYKAYLEHSAYAVGMAMGETMGRALAFALIVFFCAHSIRKQWGKKRLEFWMFCFSVSFSLCTVYKLVKVKTQLSNSKQEIV